VAGNDEVMNRFMGERMARSEGGAMLFGRRTYEQMLGYWNAQPEPVHAGAQQHAEVCCVHDVARSVAVAELDPARRRCALSREGVGRAGTR
jgi:hypothetical protein